MERWIRSQHIDGGWYIQTESGKMVCELSLYDAGERDEHKRVVNYQNAEAHAKEIIESHNAKLE